MAEDGNPIPNWQRQDLPPTLSRRYEFESYPETRRFLDGVARLAEAAQHYPNLSFGKTYVSVTLGRAGGPLITDQNRYRAVSYRRQRELASTTLAEGGVRS